ncbi:hypothetical protein [Poriferisphaera sp. WC338]|uniref:hypothetical protein n=1 Tax=Poriferisphaera sp. WC338 TaxID=3425129 RepID=UPI003D8152AA
MVSTESERQVVDKALRASGIVIVLNQSHVKTTQHIVDTMVAIYEQGYVAELTFRIDHGMIREAMAELVKLKAEAPVDKPFVLGVGSVINPAELDDAIEMGFNMIVAPGNVMGGYGEGKEFIRIAHEHDVFAAPAVFTPTELGYFIERGDDLIPDAIKIFPARTHGPKGISDLLAPFVRERHKNRIIMPTGAVNETTASDFYQAIISRGFSPVLGMSAPLQGVVDQNAPGDSKALAESLQRFKSNCIIRTC